MNPNWGERSLVLRAFPVGEGLGVVATDITDRVRATEEGVKSRDQLRLIM
jgi:hypothetical protein